MHTSTDAVLFYGYCWDEKTRTPWNIGREEDGADDADWKRRYARAKGCLPPSLPFPERTVPRTRENRWSSTPTDYSLAEQAIIDQHVAYWEEVERLAAASPCLVATHCSDAYPMPYVAVRASLTISRRSYPTAISSLADDPAWNAHLVEFCGAMTIEIDTKSPGWWLVSNWSE